ncbi:reverse transcriptase domain-containing protein [Tanacetum coccineum]
MVEVMFWEHGLDQCSADVKIPVVLYNAVQNLGEPYVGNQNGLSVGHRGLQISMGLEMFYEEFDFMAAAGAYDEIEEVTANCALKDNLQQASTSGTQIDSALVYDSNGSTEVHHSENCYDNDIFNMFTQEEQYIELLEPISEPHQAKSREELYFLNISKMTIVSKSISIPNEEFSDDTSPSVAQKFLNEVKSTIVTLQRVVKQKMTLDIHSWSSSAHQELLKIIKDEIYPIVNQVGARVQNFKIQFLKKATKFIRDFKSLANEADESFAKHKALEFDIEGLLKAVVSQDIMSIVQNNSVVDTSNLQTELDQGIVLGHKVSSAGLEVNTAKINVISKLPPLLILKDTPFEFDYECQEAFELLKEKLTCAPVIVSPNWNLPFELMCDASDFAVGVVLGQKDVFAFDKFRSYLILSKTIVHTNHSALKHLFKKQDAKPSLIRWILLLQEFDIKIKDIKCTENVVADHLSRIKNDKISNDSEVDDNFLEETLMEINTKDEPWFADFANYLVADIIPKGMTYQ